MRTENPPFVIPAQAGIQLIKQTREAEQCRFCLLRRVLFLLDSGLRRNDG
jgi:hypothetical protein